MPGCYRKLSLQDEVHNCVRSSHNRKDSTEPSLKYGAASSEPLRRGVSTGVQIQSVPKTKQLLQLRTSIQTCASISMQ